MRILVTGSRDWTDEAKVLEALSVYTDVTLAHGAAPGLDTIAGKVARDLGWEVVEYPADWKRYGRSAGPIRNTQMLKDFDPDLVIGFPLPQSRGTYHMIQIARQEGYEVKVIK